VEDTGMGISKENQLRLFQPYSQIGANAAQNGVGTGLGLSFAKR
jgi:signal transduction histidine kinase